MLQRESLIKPCSGKGSHSGSSGTAPGQLLLSPGVQLNLVWPSPRRVWPWDFLALEWEGEISGKFWIKFPIEIEIFSGLGGEEVSC